MLPSKLKSPEPRRTLLLGTGSFTPLKVAAYWRAPCPRASKPESINAGSQSAVFICADGSIEVCLLRIHRGWFDWIHVYALERKSRRQQQVRNVWVTFAPRHFRHPFPVPIFAMATGNVAPIHSPMIFTRTRLRRRPSNSP